MGRHRVVGSWQQRIARQPGWVFRAAAAATILVFFVPLALLALAAVVAGAFVFMVLGAIAAMIQLLSAAIGGTSGGSGDQRVNVRVIHRDE